MNGSASKFSPASYVKWQVETRSDGTIFLSDPFLGPHTCRSSGPTYRWAIRIRSSKGCEYISFHKHEKLCQLYEFLQAWNGLWFEKSIPFHHLVPLKSRARTSRRNLPCCFVPPSSCTLAAFNPLNIELSHPIWSVPNFRVPHFI